jgi:hypothetical protein
VLRRPTSFPSNPRRHPPGSSGAHVRHSLARPARHAQHAAPHTLPNRILGSLFPHKPTGAHPHRAGPPLPPPPLPWLTPWQKERGPPIVQRRAPCCSSAVGLRSMSSEGEGRVDLVQQDCCLACGGGDGGVGRRRGRHLGQPPARGGWVFSSFQDSNLRRKQEKPAPACASRQTPTQPSASHMET